jgi:predicted RNA-binding Zn ribbon-like protein
MDTIEHRDHRHAASIKTTLDFLNTAELDGNGRPVEHVSTLEDATAWLLDHGLLYPEEARPFGRLNAAQQGRRLAHVRAARAALREVVESIVAGRPTAASAVAAVNELLRARTVVELVVAGGALAARHRHLGDALEDALERLVDPLVESVAAGETGRLRVCANDGCRWVFEDTSPTGRRRWCSMASCGNRAKAARHRARRRGQLAPVGEAAPRRHAPVDADARRWLEEGTIETSRGPARPRDVLSDLNLAVDAGQLLAGWRPVNYELTGDGITTHVVAEHASGLKMAMISGHIGPLVGIPPADLPDR